MSTHIELDEVQKNVSKDKDVPNSQSLESINDPISTIKETTIIGIDELNSLHDPKSIIKFKNLFNNDPQNLYKTISTDGLNGLNPNLPDLDQRISKFGINKLVERKPKTFLELCWEAMHDKVLILLSVAAIVSFALGLYETLGQPPEYDAEGNQMPKVDWVEGVAIMVAILIVVLVGAVNDYQKELQFARLNAKKDDRNIIVIRGGEEHVVSIFDILVGDIISLQTGDVLPADAILIKGSCECDESGVTGESKSIHKLALETSLKLYHENFPNHDSDIGTKGVPDPFLISGSKLLSGLGRAMVTAVGPNSIHGRTMESLKIEPEQTPLQVRLNNLADGITKYGILAAAVLFIVLFARYLSYLPNGKKYNTLPASKKGSLFLDIVITAITIIVVAVPEGLPLAVTLALAFATTRMAKDDNLVRVLRACEIMGGATAICSDKTGTLTENKMKVVNGNIAGLEFDDNSHSEIKNSNQLDLLNEVKLLILTNISLNSTAFENKEANEINENPLQIKPKKHFWNKNSKLVQSQQQLYDSFEPFIGSKTETSLLSLAQRSFDLKKLSTLRADPSSLGVEEIIQIIPFESSRKWGGIVVKLSDNKFRFYIKGAAEVIFSKCTHVLNQEVQSIKITNEIYGSTTEKISSYARMALRTISLAHKDFNVSSWPPKDLIDGNSSSEGDVDPDRLLGEKNISLNDNDNDDGLILDGIVGIKDPLRPGVKGAVESCKRAGVSVRMVTGDNLITAKAISLSCGILSEKDLEDEESCLEGPIFRNLSNSERNRVVKNLKVLARSSPEDKRILVETLKKQGEVVAVTGDGTNDAPALKLADVGFSMGISGTEVAREASDIILMTDDFVAIVNAIKWGRCVSSSIKKFIQFQLTVNITAVVLTFVSAVASTDGHSVLTAVQLLWVNLIMDTLAALALATDRPDDFVLDKKPEGRSTTLISVSMWKMILGQSSLQLIVTFVIHFAGQKIFYGDRLISDHEQVQLNALTFNTFVWLQFFKLWVTRKLDEGDGIKNVKDRITASNLNFFEHLFRNYYFLGIALLIGGCQVLIMFVGGSAFSVARQTGPMWATAIICGMLSLPWGIVIRIIPDEWVIKIFPTRLWRLMHKILSFKGFKSRSDNFKNKFRHCDEDSDNDEEKEHLYSIYPAFQKTREDIIHIRENESYSDYSNVYNPFNLIHRWSSSKRTTNLSDSESIISSSKEIHTITALAMVPTVVGGAVAGWSPLSSSSHKYQSIPQN